MIPQTDASIPFKILTDTSAKTINSTDFSIYSSGGIGVAHIENIPVNCRITLEIDPIGIDEDYGLYLRAGEHANNGYNLNFSLNKKIITLGNTSIDAVDGLNRRVMVDIIMEDNIIDVEVNQKRTIVNRVYENKGNMIWFYAKHGRVNFKNIIIKPLVKTE